MSVKEPLQPNYNFAWVKADNTRLTKEELHNQRRQDMSEKPEALVIADELGALMLADELGVPYQCDFHAVCEKAAAKLRRLHAENERLREEVRNWKKSFVGHVYVKNEDYAELIGERDALKTENKRLREALESIAANACCDKCQEAALVAKAALRREGT